MALKIEELDIFKNYDDVLEERKRTQAQQDAINREAEKKSVEQAKEIKKRIVAPLRNRNMSSGESSADILDAMSVTGKMDTQAKMQYDYARRAQGEDPLLNYMEKTAGEIYDAYATDQELYDEAFTIEKWYNEWEMGNVDYDPHKMAVYNQKMRALAAQKVEKDSKNQKIQFKDVTVYNNMSAKEKELMQVYMDQELLPAGKEARAYIDAKYGEGTAKNIAETMRRINNAQRAYDVDKYATEHTVNGDVLLASPTRALVTPIISAADFGIQYLGDKLGYTTGRYEGLDPYSIGQLPSVYVDAVIEKEGDNFADWAQDAVAAQGGSEQDQRIARNIANLVYNAGESALENVVRVAVLKGYGSLALAGVAGFSEGVRNATLQGATSDQAIAMGIVSGASEILTEKIPLDNLLGTLKKAGSTASFKQILKSSLKQAGIEATTEELNFLAGLMGEAIILQEMSGYNQRIEQLVQQGVPYDDAVRQANKETVRQAGQVALQSGLSGFMTSAGTGVATNMGANTFVDAADQYEQDKEKLQEMLDGILSGNTQQGSNNSTNATEGAQAAQKGDSNQGINISDLVDETLAQANGAPEDPVGAAVEGFESTGTVSNKQANDILISAKAVQQLVQQTGVKLDGLTRAQQRQAVKTAVQVMVEKKGQDKINFTADTKAISQPLESYPVEKQNLIKSYLQSADSKIKSFVERVKNGDLTFKREKISDVSKRAAADIGRLLGIDVSGYTNNINTSGIKHILRRHGKNGKADSSMSVDEDIARVGWVLENYDTVEMLTKDGKQVYSKEFKDKNGQPIPQIRFIKKIDGTYYVVEAAYENEYKKIWVQGAYIQKSGDVTQVPAEGQTANRETNAQSELASPSPDAIIRNDSEVVNTENGAVGAAEKGFSAKYDMIDKYGAIPEGENPTRVDQLPRSTDGNDRVSRTARTALEAKVTTDAFAQLIENETVKGGFSYIPIKNSETVQEATKVIQKKGWEGAKIDWMADVRAGKSSPQMAAIGALLYNNAVNSAVTKEEYRNALDILVDYSLLERNAAQTLQAARILKTLAPEDRLYAVQKKIQRSVDTLTEDNSVYKKNSENTFEEWQQNIEQKMLDVAAEIESVPNGDAYAMANIVKDIAAYRRTTAWFGKSDQVTKRAAKVIDSLSYDDLKLIASTQLDAMVDDFRKRTPKEVIFAVRKMSMLSSIKTILRNLGGNGAVGVADSLSDSGAGQIADFLLSKVTGKRTVGNDIKHTKEYIKAAKDAGEFAMLCAELDIPIEIDAESSYTTAETRTKNEKYIGKTFRANGNAAMRFMYAYQKYMSYALEVSDKIFEGGAKSAVSESLASLKNSNLTDEEMTRLSDFAAQKRTFKDATWKDSEGKTHGSQLSQRTQKIKNATGVFGEISMPFASTPMNVSQTGIDYTTGIAKGTAEIISIIKDAKAGKEIAVERQRQAVTDFARGMTGTTMIALATIAAASGIIRAAGDEDWDKEALAQAEGRSGAQINWSALGRAITGQDTSWKSGDVVSELDFLEPFNTILYLGYELSQEESFGDALLSYPGSTFKSALKALLDSPMMTGLNDISDMINDAIDAVESGQWEDVGNAIAGYGGDIASSFIPQFVRQTAQVTDGYYRDTTGSNAAESALNKILAAIPGLSQTLPVKYSGLGQAQERNWWSTLFDPTNTQTLSVNEITTQLDSLYETTNDAAIYPERQAPKSITVNGEKILITGKEMTETYQKTYGESCAEMYDILMSDPDFQKMTPEMQAEAIKKAKGYATEFAKASVSDYEATNASANELAGKILQNEAVKQFTNAFTESSADGLDEAYKMYSGMSAEMQSKIDQEGGRVKYFLAAKKSGVASGTFLELYNVYKGIDGEKGTQAEKATQWSHALQKAKESGKITENQKTALSDAMKFWQVIPSQTQKYNDMTGAGISADKALYISDIMKGIEPVAGKTNVSYWQQAEAISNANLNESEKAAALKTYGNDAQDKNIDEMIKKGYSADDYVTALIIYTEQKTKGGSGTKERTIKQLIRELHVGRAAAEAIYNIYCQ